MKRLFIMTSIVALGVASIIYAHSQTQRGNETTSQVQDAKAQAALENTITTQQRINRYFHGDVMPRLKNCWGRVQGNGTLTLKYNYTKANGRWAFSSVAVQSSTLAKAQEAIAMKCMRDSVRGTSFPVEGSDGTEKTYVLNWSWPVPFPANAAELTSVMFAAKGKGGGGPTGGCDGHGAAASCFTCTDAGKCLKVCVGSSICVIVTSKTGSECQAVGNACASGGLFGVGGGLIGY